VVPVHSPITVAAVQAACRSTDAAQMRGPRWLLAVAGHYARPDVFHLTVNTGPRPVIVSTYGREEAAADRPKGRRKAR
jgi:hypothetical protein